jgi:hypothetical protein
MNEVVQKLIETSTQFIERLATAVGTTAVHIYEILVRQQTVEGMLGIASILSLVFGSMAIAMILDMLIKKAFPENYTLPDKVLVLIVGLFIGLFVLGQTLPLLTLSINKVVNPEYFAIVKILSEIK